MAYRKTIRVRPTSYAGPSLYRGASVTDIEAAYDGQESTCAKAVTIAAQTLISRASYYVYGSYADFTLKKDNWLSDMPKGARLVSGKCVALHKSSRPDSYKTESEEVSYRTECFINFSHYTGPVLYLLRSQSEQQYITSEYTFTESQLRTLEQCAETMILEVRCGALVKSPIEGKVIASEGCSLDLYDIYLELTYEAETSGKAKVNGEWKDCALKCKANGEWKDVTNGKVKVDGEWIEIS